jgi:hypothetical protein
MFTVNKYIGMRNSVDLLAIIPNLSKMAYIITMTITMRMAKYVQELKAIIILATNAIIRNNGTNHLSSL